jgi:type VI protein secretion system component VasF
MSKLSGNNDNIQRNDKADDARRLRQNLIVAVWVVALIFGAYWLVDALMRNQREQECLARGRRNCVPLEIPVPVQPR